MTITLNSKPWRVVLIEDNVQTLSFFEKCVRKQPGLALAASFTTLRPALNWFAHYTADLLLTDLHLPDGSGLEALHFVGAQHPHCDKLVISMFGDEEHVVSSIQAGAVGYLQKDASEQDIAKVLMDVKLGASPISPMVARGVLARLQQLQTVENSSVKKTMKVDDGSDVDRLSARENEVLNLLSRGYSYDEIAKLCQISLHTVQGHIKKIYRKLAVCSRGEAVFEASRLGLLDTPMAGDTAP
jgi:DNA-binding NarL/FixJ family response regulator